MSLKRAASSIEDEDASRAPRATKQARPSTAGTSTSQPPASHSFGSQSGVWGAVDEEEEIVVLSQDVDEGLGWVVLGAIDGKIVGVRYYNGYATVGEQVMVKREPGNPYDSNAIRINNVQGTQIGHIPRNLASKLAPLMDARSIVLEGILAGEKGQWDCPIRLRVFGPADPAARKKLEDDMKAQRVPIKKQSIAAPKKPSTPVPPPQRSQMGFQSSQGSSSQPEAVPEANMQHLIEISERFNPRDAERLVEAWGQGEDALSKMPMAEQPSDLVSTLLPYQRQGLAWMLQKENPVLPAAGSEDVVQLWKRHDSRANAFQNIATRFVTKEAPVLARGGILADDMGLGKTLQVISVILEGGPGTTLIIAPVSVMSNWVQQVERHVKHERNMKVLTYHGSARKRMTFKDFSEYDVVVTTYGTLSTEYLPRGTKEPGKLPRKEGIFSMNWARIVLDEGHTIRNPNTKSAVAATACLARCRWVLTGTPIVNTIKDLYSMLKFLGITGGLERMELFNAVLTRPLSLGDPNADLILHSIMRTLCLRRKKDMAFVDLKLPELSEYVHRIPFRADEREKYDALHAEAQGLAQRLQSAKPGQNVYRHVLEILLRMRQVCCHWKLCGARVTDLLALLEKDNVVALTKENVLALQALLQLTIESSDECPICLGDLHTPVITACKHVFGLDCISRTIELQHKCPMCRAPLVDASVLVHPKPEECARAPDADIDVDAKSSKTEALMSILRASRKDPLSKVVIFSQWTSFLDIIQAQLAGAGMVFARIDGSMSATVRDKGMTALESDPECRILLASLAVCSVGLNLVAADTVILADSWWAPAIEDQAVDRVHRLGQARPCKVFRLVMEESIEERVLDIQAEKRLLVSKAFQEKAKGEKQKTTRTADILKLLR
ncbi:hypothetical protein QTJ16_006371 [Diplocarpon rosae]|uniref:Uncharacterized protein n=1 Tax=Diplocarpon rosae TaxID=946125 RepID=A0AAD9WCI6_9HELO|nr:hypothetical protein QTJ16_006371 [Diplocarpon rosae]PBP28035.1 SNF2 family domain-containing protein [Diplocarpon rosae]